MPWADKQLTQEHEKLLWNTKELDLDTSKGLLHAVIFYLIKCFAVWRGEELRQVKTDHVSFGEDKLGKYVALDLQSSTFKRRGVVKRYDDPANPRSVYKILKKYRSCIANEGPFLVRPISSIKDFICFGPFPLGVKVIKSFISTIMEDAGIGRCFGNYSLNLQSINTLMYFGTGYHCLSSWLLKGYEKFLPTFPKCSSANCEEINPAISAMISRVLDAPHPCDAVEIIQKIEYKEDLRKVVKNSKLTPTFYSWMSNLLTGYLNEETEGVQKPISPSSHGVNLTEKGRESSGNYGTINLTGMERREPHDEKPCFNSSGASEGKFGVSELKIMAVSSITEDAFSSQVDEGGCVTSSSPQNHTIENDNCESYQKNNYLGIESKETVDDHFNFKRSSKKRKRKSLEIEHKFCKVKAKGSEFEYHKGSPSKAVCDQEKKKLPDKSTIHIQQEHSVNEVRPENASKEDTKNETNFKRNLKVNQTAISNASEDVQALTSLNCGGKFKEDIPFVLKPTCSSSRRSLNMPYPDSSQDSITILRMLLHQPLKESKKAVGEKNCVDTTVKHISVPKNGNTVTENGIELKGDEKDKSSEGDFEDSINEKCERMAKTDNNDEDEHTIDLSPPTLSPQSPTIIQETDVGSRNQESNPCNNSSLSVPNLTSPDIVQFLDKAHRQIKDILNATETENHSAYVNDKLHSKSVPSKQTEKDIPSDSKNSRKSSKPVKIIDDSTFPDLSFEKLNSTAQSPREFDDPILKQPSTSRLIEQSETEFPLLRLCLEQPIHEAEPVISCQYTSSSSSSVRRSPQSLKHSFRRHSASCSHNQIKLNESPEITCMESVTNSIEISENEGDHENDKEVENCKITCSDSKGGKNNDANSVFLSADMKEHSLQVQDPPSHSSLAPSSLITSQSTDLHSQQPKMAVHQTLHVSYEKDDQRTFTFADVPYLNSTLPPQSKNPKGCKQTSELNLGDYFPPGTLIPAKDIHLVTQQSSDGCDILMKFCFQPKPNK